MGERNDAIAALVADADSKATVIATDNGKDAAQKQVEIAAVRLKASKDLNAYKAAQLLGVLGNLPLDIPLSGKRVVTVRSATATPDYLELTVSLTVAGVDATPANFNPWRIVNPPMLVPDAAGDVSRVTTKIDGSQETAIYREDPIAVLTDLIDRTLPAPAVKVTK